MVLAPLVGWAVSFDAAHMATVATRTATPEALVPWARALGKVALAGAVTGFVFGGVGGRLAMLSLRVTSSETVRGLESDDGFIIGRFSSATVFLLGVTTALGLLAALVYAVGRGWFPRAWRPWVAAVFFGLFGGADLVTTEGIDFRLLAPSSLAIAMFVAIPAIAGFVMAWWIERWLASEHVPTSKVGMFWPLLAFVVIGPPGIVILIVLVVGWAVAQALPVLGRIWWSSPATWVGRALVLVLVVASAIELVDDASVILGR